MTQIPLEVRVSGWQPQVRSPVAVQGKKALALVPPRLSPGMLLAGPVLLLVVWEAASRLGYLSPETLTAPVKPRPDSSRSVSGPRLVRL